MGSSLLHVILVIVLFELSTENPIYSYRFEVYPVERCPKNISEFETAASRRNCTKGTRYLCAPDKYLSNLIEFCTDVPKSLYGDGNCVRLEGTGGLNHYNCVDTFISGCPTSPYTDDNIYKYPECLDINKDLKCFVAEKDCLERISSTAPSSTERYFNETKREGSRNKLTNGSYMYNAALLIGILLPPSVVISIIGILFYKKRRKIKDPENDDSQLDQAPVNVSIQNLMQTPLAKVVISETTNRYTKTLPRDNQNPEESRQNTTLIDGIQQDDLQIDDDKLREFLIKGELTVCHVRCIIVGCGEAGKTTLLKRLQNLSYDEVKQTESTEMVDFHVNSFEVLVEEETIQSVKKEDTSSTILFSKEKLEKMHANAGQWTDGIKNIENEYDEHAEHLGVRRENGPTFFEKPALEKTRNSQIEIISMNILRNPAATPILEPHVQDETLSKIKSSSETYQKQDEEIEKNADNDDIEEYAISKIKDAVNELLNEHDLRPRITFLDFAGQSMYYAFHQIFLRPKSCSILVVDMTKRLDDKVDVKNKDEKDCSLFVSWRYRDYYKFWLKSIDSFSDITTPVIVVGTHADKLSEEKCGEFFDEFFKLFDDWPHFDLRRHLNTDRIYTIGFPESGSVELKDLKDIKKCIADIMTAPGYLEENIRPVWALYEHILIKMKETRKIISRKTLSDCSDQLSAPGLRLSDDEISKMLIFLHRVGILLYFEEDDLREKIILDIQWLLDAFKCIINYRVKADVNDMKRTHFYRTGELDDAELDRIWKIEKKEYLEHKTTIIAYMQQLGLLMTFPTLRCMPSTVHYIPCMNSKKFNKTGANNLKSSILCFKFEETKQLPTNVFYGIVSKCLENWSILTEKTKDNTCLYHNAACFSFENHVVVLCICKFQILVQVWALPEIYDAKLLIKIKQSVEKLIQEYKMVSYEVGYKCQRDVLNAEKDLSFIPANIFPVSNFLCETCDVEKKHPVGNDTSWDLAEKQENDVTYRSEITGDEPGPTKYPFFGLDKSTENYIRLSRLITTICGSLLRDILSRHIKPFNLRKELDINRTKLEKIITKAQKEQIYLKAGSNPVYLKDLDISLLYILLRNICPNISKPKTGWGNPPLKGDYSVSSCIERIRNIRNNIQAHCTHGKVDDTDFQNYWDELENSIIETEKQLTSDVVYADGISMIKKMAITSDDAGNYKREFQPSKVVVALDFGTTHSGFAFSRTQSPSDIILGKWNSRSQNILESVKTPTSLLLNNENKVIEFGYEAERIFQQLVENGMETECRFFRNFKMILHNKKSINMDTMIEDHLKNPIKALEVFSLSIQCLKKKCIDFFQKNHVSVAYDDIQWILSVPAIWGESAKQFMRMAAEQADIPSDQLKLALESEAAAIYIIKSASMGFERKYPSTVEPGTKIMVADLGGGTADLTVLKLNVDKTMKQLHRSFGGAWGGNLINKKILEIMTNVFGEEVIAEFKKLTADYIDMESNIELKKRAISTGSKLQLLIHPSLADLCKTIKGKSYKQLVIESGYTNVKVSTGKLSFEPDLVKEIFDLTLTNLYTSVEKVLQNQNMKGIKDIILVGGFAQTDFIVRQFKERFSGYNVIIPTDPVLAVLKGAVMFGQDTDIISSRITPHTYGFAAMRLFSEGIDPRIKKRKVDNTSYCVDLFEKMVAIGDSVDVGLTVGKEVFASSKDMKSMVLQLYQSDKIDPMFVTDPGCENIGKLLVKMPDLSGGTERSVMVWIKFGETEISVCGEDKTTGKKQETLLDLLGDTK